MSGAEGFDLDVRPLVYAVHQVVHAGSAAQREPVAEKVLADAQLVIYLILAEQPEA